MRYYSEYYGVVDSNTQDQLTHYGVLGMKWGMRKYQYEDGLLTPAGRARYHVGPAEKGHDKKTGKSTYMYKSMTTKHNEKKAAKMTKKASEATDKNKQKAYKEKAKKYEERASRSRELDRREQEYARKQKVGRNIATRLLTGGAVGGKAYQQYLAMLGENRKGITKKKVLAAIASDYGGRLGSTAVKQLYVRGAFDKLRSKKKKR